MCIRLSSSTREAVTGLVIVVVMIVLVITATQKTGQTVLRQWIK